MEGMSFESPRGPVTIDPATRDPMQNVYIRKVERVGGELYNVEFATIPRSRIRCTSEARRLRGRLLRGGQPCRVRGGRARTRCGPRIDVAMLTILFDGIAYGMLLFLIASGLAVTLGLMNFVNLAHGAFAMAGGYVAAVLSNRLGVPFLATLPVAFLFAAALGALLEPTLYRRLYARPPLDQVLFSIGLVFMAVAAIDYFFGATQQFVRLPEWLQGRIELGGVGIGYYRLFIIVVCGVITAALQWAVAKTRFGSRLRAAVDDRRVAGGLGINVNVVFLATFAFGSGLAGLGGALGAELLGLDPTFPLKYMIYFLIVVAVGGTTTITGPLLASLLLGIADVAGKYYVPKLGAFIIYSLMIAILLLRPQGLFAPRGSR